MTATLTAPQTYNGWTNYETWNVVLWIENDEGLYALKSQCHSYDDLLEILWESGSKETPDGVKWKDSRINRDEINEAIFDEEPCEYYDCDDDRALEEYSLGCTFGFDEY